MVARTSRTTREAVRTAREQASFDALKALLEARGIAVTVSRTLEGKGGECLVRGARRVIVARRVPMGDRIEVLAEVLSRENLEGVDVPEDIRLLIGRAAPSA